MKCLLRIICFVLTLSSFELASIPSYLHPCKSGDSDCMTKEGANVLKSILKGDDTLKIPSLSPYIRKNMELAGGNMVLKIKEAQVNYLDQTIIDAVNIDVQKKTGLLKLRHPKLQFAGGYTMSGKIAVIDLNGQGNMHIDLENAHVEWNFKFDIANGHAKITDNTLDADAEGLSYLFENIINGNPELSKAANDVLLENKDLVKEAFLPGLKKIVQKTYTELMQLFFDNIPLNELVLS